MQTRMHAYKHTCTIHACIHAERHTYLREHVQYVLAFKDKLFCHTCMCAGWCVSTHAYARAPNLRTSSVTGHKQPPSSTQPSTGKILIDLDLAPLDHQLTRADEVGIRQPPLAAKSFRYSWGKDRAYYKRRWSGTSRGRSAGAIFDTCANE